MNDSLVLGTGLWLLAVSVKGMCRECLCHSHLLCHYLRSSVAGPEQLSCLYQHLGVLNSREINISCSLEFQHSEDVTKLNLGKYYGVYTKKLFMLCHSCGFVHSFVHSSSKSSAHVYFFFLGSETRH